MSWFKRIAVAVAVVAAAVLTYLVFLDREPLSLPDEVDGYERRQLIEGEQAHAILNRMHDNDVTPRGNLIGVYRGETVIYLSAYRTEGQAEEAYAKMRKSIEKGNELFDNYRSVMIRDVPASFCVGQGQQHYFFVLGKRLYWIAAHPGVAVKVARSFVRRLRMNQQPES